MGFLSGRVPSVDGFAKQTMHLTQLVGICLSSRSNGYIPSTVIGRERGGGYRVQLYGTRITVQSINTVLYFSRLQ